MHSLYLYIYVFIINVFLQQSKDEITSNFDIRDVLNKEEKNGVGEKPVLPNIAAETVDTEHLDYEEDNESKPQRSSKFRSERNTSERQQDSDFTAKNSSIKKLGFSDHVSSFDKVYCYVLMQLLFQLFIGYRKEDFRSRDNDLMREAPI